jgi:hypothetical protein
VTLAFARDAIGVLDPGYIRNTRFSAGRVNCRGVGVSREGERISQPTFLITMLLPALRRILSWFLVSNRTLATDAALSSAMRTIVVGSMMPARRARFSLRARRERPLSVNQPSFGAVQRAYRIPAQLQLDLLCRRTDVRGDVLRFALR